MGTFDGYLLVSDFDGTLIDGNGEVSSENIEAIKHFVDEGGVFCGATGRTESNVRPYIKDLPQSSPWILYNGAAIYSFSESKFKYSALLDSKFLSEFILDVITEVPKINVQIFPGGPFYQVNPNATPDFLAIKEKQENIESLLEDVPDGWLKVIFCSDQVNDLDLISQLFAQSKLTETVHGTRSGRRYFELTALGANKGRALQHLKGILSPTPRKIVAIGDYLNDVEMLKFADIAAAPESALPEVKAHAKIITRCHTKSAVADLLNQLRQ